MACLLTPPPTLSEKPIINLPTKLCKIQEHLVDSRMYLGTSAVCGNTIWARMGSAQKLVYVEPAEAEAESIVSSNTPSPSPSPSGLTEDNPSLPEVTILSAVVQISEDDFYLTSDGSYRGPSRFIKSLAQVKPSCSSGVPGAEPFNSDFATTMDNLCWLLGEATTPGFSEKRGVMTGPNNALRIKVRHLLFEPKPESDADATMDSNNGYSGDSSEKKGNKTTDNNDASNVSIEKKADKCDFTCIKNWPVTTDAAREELANMLNTHSINPVLAYDMHGLLIHPLSYHSRLAGAVVELHFELSHWSMRSQNGEPSCDTYAADVVAIRVLVPPKPTLVTPRKQKVYDRMDPFASPSPRKKARIMTLKL